MKKKFKVIMIIAIIIFAIVFITKYTNDRYDKEITHEILSYEEVPEYVKDRIESAIGASTMRIEGSDGTYIVITPPEDKSVEVLSVGKDKTYTYGVVYRYKYINEVSDDKLDNIKIIKIYNYDGSFVGVFVSH